MAATTGQITVTTAGTAVQGPDIANTQGEFFLKAHPSNTKPVWYGNDGAGDVTKDNGFPLNPGETAGVTVTNLNAMWFDSEVNGEKICWQRL